MGGASRDMHGAMHIGLRVHKRNWYRGASMMEDIGAHSVGGGAHNVLLHGCVERHMLVNAKVYVVKVCKEVHLGVHGITNNCQ